MFVLLVCFYIFLFDFFFFKQKTAYEMRISDWSSDVCSSDLLPSVEAVNEQRVAKFLDRIDTALESSDLPLFRELVERYESEHNVPMEEIAAALAQLVQGKTPLLLKAPPERPRWAGREERGREGRTASPRHSTEEQTAE